MPGEGMVEMMKDEYRVVYERDETGWWTARVPEVRGCHTQGRTVDEAHRRIREALGLFIDDANAVTLHDQVKLPGNAKKMIHEYVTLRQQAEIEARRALQAGQSAVKLLQSPPLKMSGRDAADLLGISHQRVHQLARANEARSRRHPSRRQPRRGHKQNVV